MRALVDCGGGVDVRHGGRLLSDLVDSSLFLSLAPRVDVYCPPLKRTRVSAPFIPQGWERWENQSGKVCSMDALTDECLFEILKRLGGKNERSIAACVSKRWLMLLSSIPSSEVPPTPPKLVVFSKQQQKKFLPDLNETADDEDDEQDEEIVLLEDDDKCPNRCLEGAEATDTRLVAMAVGTGSLGGVGELIVRGSHQVTDVGLGAVARNSPFLTVLSMWNTPAITDEALSQIASCCPLLEKLDLCNCPLISDKGITAIAMKCPGLSSLTIQSCQKIGDEGLRAIGRFCPNLKSISIVDLMLVGDCGIAGLVSSASSSLQKMKLQRLAITDMSLAVIGHYGKAVTDLIFANLPNVGDKGFWVMGSARGLQKLKSFTIASCGVTDVGLEAVAKGCPLLKQLCLQRCHMSDAGMEKFAAAAGSLEFLQLEECNCITLCGIVGMLLSCKAKLRSLTLIRCMGIRDVSSLPASLRSCLSLRLLSIRQCSGFGNSSLALIGKLCRRLQHLNLCELNGVTDAALVPLFEHCESGFVKVNLGGCVNVTDAAVSVLVKRHGATLQTLNIEGCRKVTDESLSAIADCCVELKDLDVSRSAITDDGVAALTCAIGGSLKVLSLSGCSKISARTLLHLSNVCQSLLGLNLLNCNLVTGHDIASFQKKMWQCDILA